MKIIFASLKNSTKRFPIWSGDLYHAQAIDANNLKIRRKEREALRIDVMEKQYEKKTKEEKCREIFGLLLLLPAVLFAIGLSSVSASADGNISISSTPSGASIYIDGSPSKITPNIIKASEGSHTIRLILDQYDDWTSMVNVVKGNTTTISATLNKTAISVSSTPSGATILLDDNSWAGGKTPFIINRVSPGLHTLKLTLNEYDEWKTSINAVEGSTTMISATLNKTSISVSSTPSGALIFLDGAYNPTLITPFIINRVTPGLHTLKLTLKEYDDWTTKINVVEGSTTTIAATFNKTAISVSSTPSGAYISLDGDGTVRYTPFIITNVLPGTHTLKLSLNGYNDWTTTVNVAEGNTTTVSAALSLKSPTQTPAPAVVTPTIALTSTATNPSPTSIIDNTSPAISLSKSIVDFNKNGQLEEGEKVDITYGASDESGIKSIKVLLDGNLIDLHNSQGTFHIITDSLTMGDHSIVVEALDSKGNKNSEKMNITAARAGPSVYFPKSRYEVAEGEDFSVALSAVNPIGNPKMEALLILIPPGNGISVYESDCKGYSGQCTGKFEIEPGDSVRSVSTRMKADRAGEYQINAQIWYQFENGQRSPTRYETFTVVVKPGQTPGPTNTRVPSAPGFEFANAIFGLLIIIFIGGSGKLRSKHFIKK